MNNPERKTKVYSENLNAQLEPTPTLEDEMPTNSDMIWVHGLEWYHEIYLSDSKLAKAEIYSINEHMFFAYWNNEDMAFYFRKSPDELRVKLNTLASILFLEMPEYVSSDDIEEVVNRLRREAAKRMNKSIEELCLEWRARV